MAMLLAVDLGLKTGLALYNDEGQLRWYRSKTFGTAARLRRGVRSILGDIPDLAWLVIEGSGSLADIWAGEAERRGALVRQVSAEVWRQRLLYPRQRRRGQQAKRVADQLARRVIEWSNAPRPTSLRHDAAEAILIGLWGVVEVGWLERVPFEVGR